MAKKKPDIPKSSQTIAKGFALVGPAARQGFVALGDQTVDNNKTPRQKYTKDMIAVGLYTHPQDGWACDVTVERMDRWIAAFHRMSQNGVNVEVVVDHSFKAEDIRGYMLEMYREGDRLYGVHEMIGPDGIALAERAKDVSVWIDLDFVDGMNRSYGEAIVHSAVVQQPVVPDQKEFMPIAASRYLIYSQQTNSEANTMTLYEKLKELLGAQDVTEDNACGLIEARIKTETEAKAAVEKLLTEAQGEIVTLKAAASKVPGKKPDIDPDTLEMLAEGTEQGIDSLVNKGNITPAVAASLKTCLVGPEGKRLSRMLSKLQSGSNTAVAKQVIDALAHNDPVTLGEQTKNQAVMLGRQIPGDNAEQKPDPKQQQERGDYALSVGGAPPKAK